MTLTAELGGTLLDPLTLYDSRFQRIEQRSTELRRQRYEQRLIDEIALRSVRQSIPAAAEQFTMAVQTDR